MKTLLSLFDYSGQWSAPFAANGWNVIQWDIKLSDYMDINRVNSAERAIEEFDDVDGIIAAPPCTEFTVSCNRLWDMKDADGRTAAAMALVEQTLRLVDLYTPTDPDYDDGFFWGLENPVGRLSKLIPAVGEPWYFNPWEFAGHLNPSKHILTKLDKIREKNGIGITKEEARLIRHWNVYTKRTGIWGDFNRNMVKKPIAAVKGSPGGSLMLRSGGKSAKTKEVRSFTPEGFAQAFYEANHDFKGQWYKNLQAEFYHK